MPDSVRDGATADFSAGLERRKKLKLLRRDPDADLVPFGEVCSDLLKTLEKREGGRESLCDMDTLAEDMAVECGQDGSRS